MTEDEQAFLKEIQQATDMSDGEIRAIEEKVKEGKRIKLDEKECI